LEIPRAKNFEINVARMAESFLATDPSARNGAFLFFVSRDITSDYGSIFQDVTPYTYDKSVQTFREDLNPSSG
jgi:hypothetical protein